VAYQDLRVIDFHVHFPTSQRGSFGPPRAPQRSPEAEQAVRTYAEALRREWRLAWDFPEPEREQHSDEEQADRWAAEVDRYGLDYVGFVTGGGNDNLARVVARHPDKFVGFAHHSPFAEGAADELERAVRTLGLRGYKIIAPALEQPIDDRAAYPVWEKAAELGIPVLIHFGILGGGGGVAWHVNMDPLRLHNVARDFPTVPFVVPHFGCGYVRETLHLCWSCGNVHIDTSGSNQWIRWMPEELTLKALFRKYLETIGAERIVFGSDSSWFPRGFAVRYLQDQIRDCRELNLSAAQLHAIFSGNAARLLRLDAPQ
jgi:predicted TIM-barrel fold metal-dependent hydrolase